MTLTVADIERWDAGSVREVFHAASSRAHAAADAADGLASLPVFTSWGGVAADAARAAIGRTRKDLDAHGREALVVANAARSAADEIDRIKSNFATLKANAESVGMEIDSVTGKVLPGRSVRDPMEAFLKEQQVQSRLDKIVAEANLVDMALANAIHMVDGSVPFDTRGGDQPNHVDQPPRTEAAAAATGTTASGQPANLDAALSEVAGQPVGAPAAALDRSLNTGADNGDETPFTRSPLTAPIVGADPSVVNQQRARVESARRTLDAAQASLDAAAAQPYTRGAGSGASRSDTGALSQAVFDARRDLTAQTKILEGLHQAAAGSGGPTVPVPALPENVDVQAFPARSSAFAEGSRALNQGSLGIIPDVAKDVDVFTNWGKHSGAEQAGAVVDAAGLVPIPGAKGLTEGIEHGLDALNAARHLDDVHTYPVDDVAGAHHLPDGPHHATDTPGWPHIGDDTGHAAPYGIEDTTALLATSEAAGGHLMERHVGQTVDDLAARLERRPGLVRVSTFTTADEAAAAVSTTIQHNQGTANEWIANGAKGILELDAPFSGGALLDRGAVKTSMGTHVRVVLIGDGPELAHPSVQVVHRVWRLPRGGRRVAGRRRSGFVVPHGS